MPGLIEPLIEMYHGLPDQVKLIAFVIVFILAVAQTVRTILEWRKVRHLEEELERTKEERDELQKRFDSLNKVDDLVWTKPDAFNQNRFTSKTTRTARFVAICNFKGGVGKTTLTLNLGVALAMRKKRVLLVDLDWQGTLSNLALPQDLRDDYRKKKLTTEILFTEDVTVLQAQQMMFQLQYAALCRIMLAHENLEMIEFETQSRFFLDPKHDVRFFLQRLLHSPEIAQAFDFVLFDCPPRMTTACINALTCADYLLVPTSLSQLDIEAVPRTLNSLRNLHSVVRAEFLGAVITRGKMRNGKLTKDEKDQQRTLKDLIERHQTGQGFVFSAIIPDSPIIHKYAAKEKAVVAHEPQIRTYFEAVAQELERKVAK